MAGVSAGLVWSSYAISSTLRPSRPPLALTSSTHMRSASSAAWPPAPSEPVCGMLMPTLIGPDWASASALNRIPTTNEASLMGPPPRAILIASGRNEEDVHEEARRPGGRHFGAAPARCMRRVRETRTASGGGIRNHQEL